MNHLVFSEQPDYPIVFLVPSISKDGILKEYITPFGLPTDDIAIITLHYSQTKKKTPVAEMKEYIESELINVLENLQAKYLLVADTDILKKNINNVNKVMDEVGEAVVETEEEVALNVVFKVDS